jgi:hypothetical protein
VANYAVVIAVTIIINATSFGSFPGCLPEIAEPVCYFPNIPEQEKQQNVSILQNVSL